MRTAIALLLASKESAALSELLDIPFETAQEAVDTYATLTNQIQETLEFNPDPDAQSILIRDYEKGRLQIINSLIAEKQRHD